VIVSVFMRMRMIVMMMMAAGTVRQGNGEQRGKGGGRDKPSVHDVLERVVGGSRLNSRMFVTRRYFIGARERVDAQER
jgi:hypothetical protein